MTKGVFSSLALTLVLSTSAWGSPRAAAAEQPAVASPGVVSCSAFASALRRGTYPFRALMQSSSAIYTGANRQSVRYLAVQPGAGAGKGYPTVVFFDGTSQVTPDWPAGMLVSSSSSLCQHAALVFFDYAGIGGTAYPGETAFTFDATSATVFGLLSSLDSAGALTVGEVDPAGWSLGTAAALKFAVLAAHNQSFKSAGMSIGKLFLIAVKSGGDLLSSPAAAPSSCAAAATREAFEPPPADPDRAGSAYYTATGNQALCATAVLDQLLVRADFAAGVALKNEFAKLLFPYVYKAAAGGAQAPYGAGDPASICAMTIAGSTVESLCNLASDKAIETACDASASSPCASTLALLDANREASPYLGGLSYPAFFGERGMIFHFDYAQCSSAAATAWQSTGCQINPHQTGNQLYNASLVVDGSPCRTVQTGSADAAPTIESCPGISGAPLHGVEFFVWSGEEDLLIRSDSGQVLCTWLTEHDLPCTYRTFANAGHGVLYSDASTIFQEIAAALAARTP
jgi:hypothetical protein